MEINITINEKNKQAMAFYEYLKTLPFITIEKPQHNQEINPTFSLSEEQKKTLDSQKDLDDSEYQDSDDFLTELKKAHGL